MRVKKVHDLSVEVEQDDFKHPDEAVDVEKGISKSGSKRIWNGPGNLMHRGVVVHPGEEIPNLDD